MPSPRPVAHPRSHDYPFLIRRWRAAARRHRLVLEPYFETNGYQLYYGRRRRPDPARPWIYISAGIHGDESAATEGFLAWITSDPPSLARFNPLFFPCLNPWGLVNNSRLDADGRDLNRTYHDDSVPQTAAHKTLLAGRRFALALTLHEDYDAPGFYIYEVRRARPYWAEDLLAAAARHVPIDTRRSIEGRPSKAGIVRRPVKPDSMLLHPEAFTLHFGHADRTFTVETPSEYHVDTRVAAHRAVIDLAVRKCLADNPESPRPPGNS